MLITGGSSGIGKMMALGFAQNGAKVYIAARKEGQFKEVCATCVLSILIPTFFFQAVADINKVASGPKADYIAANVGVRSFVLLFYLLPNSDRLNECVYSPERGVKLLLQNSANARTNSMFS